MSFSPKDMRFPRRSPLLLNHLSFNAQNFPSKVDFFSSPLKGRSILDVLLAAEIIRPSFSLRRDLCLLDTGSVAEQVCLFFFLQTVKGNGISIAEVLVRSLSGAEYMSSQNTPLFSPHAADQIFFFPP